MRKEVLFLLPLFLGAYSGSKESPIIAIEKLCVKVDQGDGETIREDYANRMSEISALKVGNKVDALLILDGNGAELKSLRLQSGEEMKIKLRCGRTEIITGGNLTDGEGRQLRFKGSVAKTKTLIHITTEHVDKSGDIQLSFYLPSKTEYEGAQEVADLETEVVENE